MKKNHGHNIDGFTLRRRSRQADGTARLDTDRLPVPEQFLKHGSGQSVSPVVDRRLSNDVGSTAASTAGGQKGISKSDIDASLHAIDRDQPKPKRRRRMQRKTIKRIVTAIIVLCLVIALALGIKAVLAGLSIFKGNIFDVFSSKQLKQDANGRTNILIFGTSEDDPSHVEEGSGTMLTDSIMLLSVNQSTKDVAMVSIPRDLWVTYGAACTAGYEGKINALYECYNGNGSVEQGAKGLMDKVSEVTGLELQYYVKVGYTTVRDAVNAVGGITVKIESDDPRGIYDPNFDWMCNRRCTMVKHPNGNVQLDGEHALALSRARDSTGNGYGLDGGNFAREQYQQKIMIAIKDKAVSAGTLANPVAVSGLMDTIGKNIKTNFETGEIRTLASLGQDIQADKIKRLTLSDKEKPLVTTGLYSGQSIVRPVAGIDDFSDIQSYMRKNLSGDQAASEDAVIDVLNGTTIEGLATQKKTEFEGKGLTISSVGNAQLASAPSSTQWYDLSGGTKPRTAEKLKSVLGSGSSGTSLPSGLRSEADFVIILGNGSD